MLMIYDLEGIGLSEWMSGDAHIVRNFMCTLMATRVPYADTSRIFTLSAYFVSLFICITSNVTRVFFRLTFACL